MTPERRSVREISLDIIKQVWGEDDGYNFTDDKHPFIPLMEAALLAERERYDALQIRLEHDRAALNAEVAQLTDDLQDYKDSYDPVKSGLRIDENHCACAYDFKKAYDDVRAEIAKLSSSLSVVMEALKTFAEIDECGDGFNINSDMEHDCWESVAVLKARQALASSDVDKEGV